MKNWQNSYQTFLASIVLLLVLVIISSTWLISTAQGTSSAEIYAYVTNCGSNTVSVIDTATDTVIATIAVGYDPRGVAVTPDGKKVYVANENLNVTNENLKNQESDTVSVIDTETNTVIATVDVGENPIGVAVSPDGSKVYVANSGGNTVSVIDTGTNAVTDTVDVENYPVGVAVSQDGKKVYVAHGGNDIVSVIDTSTNTVTATVIVGVEPYGVALSPNGKKVYVANTGGMANAVDDTGTVTVIDTATNTVIATVHVGIWPYGVVVTPDGTKVYVTNCGSNNVSVIDTTTNTVTATVPVGKWPFGVGITPDGKKVYVVNSDDNTVSVIDTGTNTVTDTMDVENYPQAIGQFIATRLSSTLSTPTEATTTEISLLNTMTSLTSSANSYLVDQPITLTATVDTTSQETGNPSGTVTFMDGTTFIGTGDVNSGKAILTTSSFSAGSHSITAEYSGDSNFKSSTSSAFTLTVLEESSPETPVSDTKKGTPSANLSTTFSEQSTPKIQTFRGPLSILSQNQIVVGVISTVVGGYILGKIQKKENN